MTLVLIAAVIARSFAWQIPQLTFTLNERELSVLKDQAERDSVRISPDGRRICFVRRAGNKWIPSIDGVDLPTCDQLTPPQFTHDGKHAVFFALRSGLEYCVVDGREDGGFESILQQTLNTVRDSRAYVAVSGGNGYAVVDGRKIDIPITGACGVLVSPDGKHYAFAGGRGVKMFVVLDGRELGEFNKVLPDSLAFSADGAHFACLIQKEAKGTLSTLLDGKEYPGPERPFSAKAACFSPDGRRVALQVSDGEKGTWSVNGQNGPFYKTLGSSGCVFSPDGSHFAYVGFRSKRESATVVDGIEVATGNDSAPMPTFGPDGTKLVYFGKKDGDALCFVNGIEVGRHRAHSAGEPVFSADGQHLAYSIRRNVAYPFDTSVSVEGVVGKSYDRIDYDSLQFSPDGKRFGYSATRGGRLYVVSNSGEKEYDAAAIALGEKRWSPGGVLSRSVAYVGTTMIRFSPNSKHMAYFALAKGKGWRLHVDGEEGPACGAPVSRGIEQGPTLCFLDDHTVMAYVWRGDRLMRVEVQVAEAR